MDDRIEQVINKKLAFAADYLGQDAEGWYAMIKSRNLTSHVYSERVSAEIVNQVEGQYAFLLKELSDFLMENFYHAED